MLQEHLMSNERKIQLIRAALESEYGYVTSSQRPILLEGRNDRVRPKKIRCPLVLHRQPCTVLWPTACYTIGQSIDLSIYERSEAANWPLVTREAFDLGSLHF